MVVGILLGVFFCYICIAGIVLSVRHPQIEASDPNFLHIDKILKNYALQLQSGTRTEFLKVVWEGLVATLWPLSIAYVLGIFVYLIATTIGYPVLMFGYMWVVASKRLAVETKTIIQENIRKSKPAQFKGGELSPIDLRQGRVSEVISQRNVSK